MLVILDRDGVINHDSDHYIKSPEEWLPIDGSLEAIARLIKAGHQVVVATNQSGVARGYYTLATLDDIHQKMHDALAEHEAKFHGVYFCPHHPDEGCDCRKPAPGLLQQIAKDFNADLSQAVMLGDKLSDIQVAQAAGCPAVLVRTGRGEQTIAKGEGLEGVPVYDDLSAWVKSLS
ncbi:MAG: D-glycero-beta-D-manno-heptose 1,7-bisphosphate 7-phosphatase [Coxiellaceae bacterium]|nr:D-glycero-beta-D-manno-heptose 1,7-bisphosphate 7-phosphatase [Coxiellaceae bacterium]